MEPATSRNAAGGRGVFLGQLAVPNLRRLRPEARKGLHELQRRRARAAREDTVSESAARYRRRPGAPDERSRRGRRPRGPAGDLLLEIHVEPHPEFTRDGLDIRSSIKVPVRTAILGGEVETPTLRGRVGLKVPKGTSSDSWLRIRGQGIATQGGTGDHLVRVVITVPKELSKEAEEALAQHLG
jgi:DnaJ-class molecular chaperone